MKLFRKFFHKIGFDLIRIDREKPSSWQLDPMRRFRNPQSCQIRDLELIYSHFAEECPKVFVDIGGYDGFTYSNTWSLAANDWLGFIFEPDPESASLCKVNLQKFPNVKIINKAISRFNGNGKLYRAGELSTLDSNMAILHKSQGWSSGLVKGETIEVECETIDQAFERESIHEIGVLSVDVEGQELDVLQSLNFTKYRPKIMIWELKELVSAERDYAPKWNSVRKGVEDIGYRAIYRDYINTVFVDKTFFINHNCL
jgi:FkbM family methyltransferase